MSQIKIDIEHVAKLTNLDLSEDEKDLFQKQLTEVLGYVESLNKIDTEKVEPIGHITGLENVNREDVATPSLTQEEATIQAPSTHNGFIAVDAVLENS